MAVYPSKYSIRPIKERDHNALMSLAREAFWNLYVPGCEEHLIVKQLLNHADWLTDYSFLIEDEQQLVGAIFYSKATVERPDGSTYQAPILGPLFVSPALHRQGLGRQLVEHSLRTIKERGDDIVFVMGYDYHYMPYGFLSAKKYQVSLEDGVYYKGVMALCWAEDQEDFSGKLQVSSAYIVDPVELAEFDQHFEAKEKQVLPSQEQFAQAVVTIDEAEYD